MLTESLAVLAGLSTLVSAAEAKAINATNPNAANVDLCTSTKGGCRNKTAPLLYGWMIEDINVRKLKHTQRS